MDRRDLFKAFMVTAAAAGVERVQAVDVPEDAIFVLHHPMHLSSTALENITESWKHLLSAHGIKPPPLIILEEGATLEVLSGKTKA